MCVDLIAILNNSVAGFEREIYAVQPQRDLVPDIIAAIHGE